MKLNDQQKFRFYRSQYSIIGYLARRPAIF